MAVVHRTCPLCEATCGLEITLSGHEVRGVRGDGDDVFSEGFLCPKAYGLKGLQEDPDRLRTPMRRTPAGDFEAIGWDEAFAEIDRRLGEVIVRHGRQAIAAYVGNPAAHNLSALLYGRALLRALGTRNLYSAATVDQFPKQMAAALMFGTSFSVPIPDVDRTDHLLILGANPLASNGSLMTAPNIRGRLRAIQQRGGRVVVVDPRRSRTAEVADEHVFIRPGTDALLLFGMVHALFEEELESPGALADLSLGIDEVRALSEPFAPEAVADTCGVPAPTIRRLTRELTAAETAAVYGRIGTTTQRFGTLASWLVDVLNVLTGNLDRRGGAMFTRPALAAPNTKGEPGRGRGVRFGRWQSRVRGLGEIFGELPAVCLAEEIDTPGEDQVRALVTLAGNPALSTPNAGRLDAALGSLELMVSVDIYVNETTRHADFILPGPAPLERGHYDVALYQFGVRNVAHYSPAHLAPEMPDEWRTLLRLAGVAAGMGPDADVDALDEQVALEVARREASDAHSPVAGRDPGELLAELRDAAGQPRRGPERLLDLMLRCGPYRLTLADLEAAPHGIDLGPLEPRLPEMLRTPSGRIELAPPAIVADVARLRGALAGAPAPDMVLVGRRQLRSNNSWMHNLPALVKGPVRCTAHVHPDDAERLGLRDGEPAIVTSRTGSVQVPVEVTDAIMPGVVSIPHGWGHDAPGARMAVAARHAGANSNLLADELLIDEVSGNAVLNGIPVTLAAVAPSAQTAPEPVSA
jgi:anaerobic selenocysteine-containing dehydrogenase